LWIFPCCVEDLLFILLEFIRGCEGKIGGWRVWICGVLEGVLERFGISLFMGLLRLLILGVLAFGVGS
jgi:hypothetical protein